MACVDTAQVAMEGGKKGKEGGGKKAAAVPVPDQAPQGMDEPWEEEAPEASGSGRSGDDDDRWGFECFRCGRDGDLLCCEARALLSQGFQGPCPTLKQTLDRAAAGVATTTATAGVPSASAAAATATCSAARRAPVLGRPCTARGGTHDRQGSSNPEPGCPLPHALPLHTLNPE